MNAGTVAPGSGTLAHMGENVKALCDPESGNPELQD